MCLIFQRHISGEILQISCSCVQLTPEVLPVFNNTSRFQLIDRRDCCAAGFLPDRYGPFHAVVCEFCGKIREHMVRKQTFCIDNIFCCDFPDSCPISAVIDRCFSAACQRRQRDETRNRGDRIVNESATHRSDELSGNKTCLRVHGSRCLRHRIRRSEILSERCDSCIKCCYNAF